VFSEIAVVVVDNSSPQEGLSKIRQAISRTPNVDLLESSTNRGYFGAAKFALDHYLASGRGLPDWVIVCNHDVLIEDADFFSKLFAQDTMAAGVIAPRIEVLPSRVDQNPFMRHRPGWLRWASVRLTFSSYGVASVWDWLSRQKQAAKSSWFARRGKTASISNGSRKSIYAPHGAFFIFSRRYFKAGGYLDGNLFLYFEEVAVAEICRSLGLAVIYEPSLCVVHNEHQSTGERLSRFSYECHKRALRYIRARYLPGSREFVVSCRPDLVP
jgi:GT2 family glycosyltransferase